MTKTLRLSCASVALALVLASCAQDAGPSATSEVPTVNVASFPEPARDRATTLAARVDAEPTDAAAIESLAMLAHAFGLDETAIALYRHAESLRPDAFAYPYLRGLLLASRGDTATASDSLMRAHEIDRGYLPLSLKLAELDISAGRTVAAIDRLTVAVDANPESAPARLALGRALADSGANDAAITHLSRAIELVPHYGAAHYALARAYSATGDARRGNMHRALFERYRRASAPLADPLLERVERLRGSTRQDTVRAGRLLARGQHRDAAAVFVKMLTEDPNDVVAHTNLVGIYGGLGEIDKATEHYRAGAAIAPREANLHNNYGVLMLRQARYDEAIDAFRAAIDAEPRLASAHRYLGLSLERSGDRNAAIDSYRAATFADPFDHQAGYLLGVALLESGDAAGAIEALTATLEPENEKTPMYLVKLAEAYHAAGMSGQMFDALSRARQMATRRGQARLAESIDENLLRLEDAAGTP